MCFNIERQKVAKVARKDIRCYKSLLDTFSGLTSPMNPCIWTVGKVKKANMVRLATSYINIGLHAGKTFKEAKQYGENVYEFTIPKGALYFENDNQYVADMMYLTTGKRLRRNIYTKK